MSPVVVSHHQSLQFVATMVGFCCVAPPSRLSPIVVSCQSPSHIASCLRHQSIVFDCHLPTSLLTTTTFHHYCWPSTNNLHYLSLYFGFYGLYSIHFIQVKQKKVINCIYFIHILIILNILKILCIFYFAFYCTMHFF